MENAMKSMISENEMRETLRRHGAFKSAVLEVAAMPFRREFRDACKANSCGKYGKCWTCPPNVGDIDELIVRAKGYERCLLFQTVSDIEDSFDIEGMLEAGARHNRITREIKAELMPRLPADSLLLSAGGCRMCERCAKEDDQPCRYPGEALASLEAYGIPVSEAAAMGGMKYINGPNTVTYFSAIFYNGGERA